MKRTTVSLAVLVQMFFAVAEVQAEFITLDVPGCSHTVATGIDGEDIVGHFHD